MYLAMVVSWKHPTAQFSWSGTALAGLTWLSVEIPRPTQADLDTWAAEFEAAGGIAEHTAKQIAEDVVTKALARACWEEIQKCQPRVGQTLLDLLGFRDRVRVLIRQLLTP